MIYNKTFRTIHIVCIVQVDLRYPSMFPNIAIENKLLIKIHILIHSKPISKISMNDSQNEAVRHQSKPFVLIIPLVLTRCILQSLLILLIYFKILKTNEEVE